LVSPVLQHGSNVEGNIEQFIERLEFCVKSIKLTPLRRLLREGLLTLVELLNLVPCVVNVLPKLHRILDGVIDSIDAIEKFNFFKAFLVGLKVDSKFIFLLFKALEEVFLLLLNFGVTLLNDVTDLHGPHLLTESLDNVILLVEKAVLIEKLLVLDSLLKLIC
jgi:hypothetical protein